MDDWTYDNLVFGFMGSRYISTDIFEQRVTEEKSFYTSVEKKLRSEGIYLPSEGRGFEATYSRSKGKPKKVYALEARVVTPGSDSASSLFSGDYPVMAESEEGYVYRADPETSLVVQKVDILRYSKKRRRLLNYYQGFLRSSKRSVELAAKKWIDMRGDLPNVGWNIPDWNQGKLKPKARNVYNRLDFGDVMLAYRVRPVGG